MNKSPYRLLKWTWLLSQGLMPILAAVYVSGFPRSSFLPAGAFWKFLFSAGSTGALVLWLIAEALLLMYRFPLKTSGAVKLVAGFFIQFLVLLLTGGSPGFAAFVYIFVTLAALAGCFLLILGRLAIGPWREGKGAWNFLAVAGFLLAAGFFPLILLFPYLRAGFQGQCLWSMTANGIVLLVNTGITIRTLIDFSIYGRPDPLKEAYYEEWEHWAAPTVILLILSVVAAVVVAGVRGSMR